MSILTQAEISINNTSEHNSRQTFPTKFVENFDAMRKDDGQDHWIMLENISPVFSSKEHLQAYFEEVLQSWQFIYDENKVRKAIQTAEDEVSQKYLKTVRRYGLVFKASYKFFHHDHYAPDSLQNFVKIIGDFNDHIHDPKRHFYALNLLSSNTLAELNSENFTYEATTHEAFIMYVQKTIDDIEGLIDKDILSVIDFHKLRKKIRLIMNVLQIPASNNLDSPVHHLFLIFYKISKQMGDQHDEIVQETIGNPELYSQHTVLISPQIRSDFERAKKYLLKSCQM